MFPRDYQEALEIVSQAEESFEALPAQVKKRYPDIASFVEGLEKMTLEEAQELGLSEPKIVEPVKAEVK